MRAIGILAAAMILTGCTGTAQRQAHETMTATRNAALARQACIKAVMDKPEYAPLLPHTPMLDNSQPTMAQLTDETIPSAQDARLFAARFDEMAPCRSRFLTAVSAVRPDLAPILAEAMSARAATVALVVERKITWAEYTRRLQAAADDSQRNVAAANRQWAANLNASSRADDAACQGYGLPVGSADYAQCRMTLRQQHTTEDAIQQQNYQQLMQTGLQMMQRPMLPPPTICHTTPDWMGGSSTTCQ